MPLREILAAMRARWMTDDREKALMERENRVSRREQELDELLRTNRELRRKLTRSLEIMEKE
jgi:hypothetical protein